MTFREKLKNNLEFIIVLSSILTLITGAIIWGDKKLEKYIDKKIVPYQHLISAVSLNNNGKYEMAIIEFEKAFNSISKEEPSETRLISVIGPYLEAIGQSDNPEEHQPDFESLIPFIEKKIPVTGDDYLNIGWVRMSLNEPEKALDCFQKSSSLFKKKEYPDQTGDAYWSQCIAYMALDSLQLAKESLVKAGEWNTEHKLEKFKERQKSLKESYWIQSYIKQYECFEKNFDKLIEK